MKKSLTVFTTFTVLIFSGLLIFQNRSLLDSSKISDLPWEHVTKKITEEEAERVPGMLAAIERERRTPVDLSAPAYSANYLMQAYENAKNLQKLRPKNDEINFIARGPGNISGRTRAVVVDPRDPNQLTWIVGAASGGIWKTTNGGFSWTEISGNLPNLGTNALALAPSNPDVIYAGTGEHYIDDIDGSGMFKTEDGGQTWFQIADPSEFRDFRNVGRIIVDPNDEDVVLAVTRNSVWEEAEDFQSSIFKSTDGGQNWTRVFTQFNFRRLDDLDYDPTNFNIQYAAISGFGVVKSTDGGDTWTNKSTGLFPGGRVEITVSPANPSVLWASAVGNQSGTGSDLYVSLDAAETWSLCIESNSGNNVNFLDGQGFYDNIITGHPFDEREVYVGGVDLWKFDLTGATGDARSTIRMEENGTEEFLSFINFTGNLVTGLGLGSIDASEINNIEIRFGQGTQLAHRFTVNGQGAGVPDQNYLYQDYVEVPFQVWDIDNNRQLMVSFRDQQEDGSWNLIEANSTGDGADDSREYLFVHDIEYGTSPSPQIAINGGQALNSQFFIWPVLNSGATFDPSNLPNSNLFIKNEEVVDRIIRTINLSDSRDQFDSNDQYRGINRFPQGSRNVGIHPDHHNIIALVTNEISQRFRLLVGTDGGMYISSESSNPGNVDNSFTYRSVGYLSTQFYGADKAPGTDRYVGGMQDNGTWFTPTSAEGINNDYEFLVSGDGFEVIWNNLDPNKIIGGSQFNGLVKTEDGGVTRESAAFELGDVGGGNAPFRTRLSNSRARPNTIFTVGATGVWKSPDFGDSWEVAEINEFWSGTSSSTDVEVSTANPNVIWAGTGMTNGLRLHVSTDGGSTFDPVNNYTTFEMGLISGIGTDPTDDNAAYALFSFANRPKVLKTTNRGQSWEDISGFEGSSNGESTRGFPDVAVNGILVFPNDNNRIWVGSEIGIIETLDGGQSWGMLECNLPPVNVHDFKVQNDQVVLATYGQGIWSVTIPEVETVIEFPPVAQNMYIRPDGETVFELLANNPFDSVQVFVDGVFATTFQDVSTGIFSEGISNLGLEGLLPVVLIGFIEDTQLESEPTNFFFFEPTEVATEFTTNFSDINPNSFAGIGIDTRLVNGFSDEAAHTNHPYPDGSVELFYILKTPLEVVNSNAILQYDDVAIVETGLEGAFCPEEDFFDFVVVEGSTDGNNWVALNTCYDASFDTNWETIYNSDGVATEQDFILQTIDLASVFEPGDQLLLRWRLFSDPLSVGWGWAFDNIVYNPGTVSTNDIVRQGNNLTSVFPNPVNNMIHLEIPFDLKGEKTIVLRNLNGQILRQQQVGDNVGLFSIPRENLAAGMYIMTVSYENKIETHRLILK